MRARCFLMMLLLACPLLACPLLAQADVVIRGTRVIYDEALGERVVSIRQVGDGPKLVQIWLDNGDDSIEPRDQDIPFLVTPSVTRMDPDTGHSIRILRVGEGLAQDRESLFWFNTLEVPPSPTGLVESGENFIQFASRIRLKFFYRPKGLQPALDRVVGLLRFSLSETDPDGRVQVRVRNPSPYHITFRNLTLRPSANEDAPVLADMVPGNWMVAPMDELVVLLQPTKDITGSPDFSDGTQVVFGIVNDYGGVIAGQQGLGSGE